MKKLLTTLFIALALFAQAQTDSIQAAYLRFPDVPPFQLLSLDSSTFITKKDLNTSQPLLLMFFSPDCDHCQHQMEDMLKQMDLFNNIQVVMATFQPFENMKAFYEKYQLSKYPNIRMGRDIKYFLPPFFRMQSLPHMALYNANGKLITTFEGNVKPEKLAKAFER